MFVDRIAELAFLNRVLANQQHPGPGQLVMLYGRRRVGKSTLLRHWAEQSGAPFTYWVAEKTPAAIQRRRLFASLINADPAAPGAPAKQRTSRQGRYHLSDPFMRFYFRFI